VAFFYAHFRKGAGLMKLNEEEKRMVYQIESTNQNAALNEIYMTWRYTKSQATKDTAESLLKKLRPLSDNPNAHILHERLRAGNVKK